MRNIAQDCNDCCAGDSSSAQHDDECQRMISKKKLHAVSYDTEVRSGPIFKTLLWNSCTTLTLHALPYISAEPR